MNTTIEQWRCPPLNARLSKQQCSANRRLAAEAASPYDFANAGERLPLRIGLRECLNCRGVQWWARKTGEGPVRISVESLRNQHHVAEERRKRLAG